MVIEKLIERMNIESVEEANALKTIAKDLSNEQVYEICTRYIQGETLDTIKEDVDGGLMGLLGFSFRKQRRSQQEEDEFIANPAEVVEGVLQCECGSKRTVQFTLQTQSGDEGTGVWARCVDCKRTWRA